MFRAFPQNRISSLLSNDGFRTDGRCLSEPIDWMSPEFDNRELDGYLAGKQCEGSGNTIGAENAIWAAGGLPLHLNITGRPCPHKMGESEIEI